MKNKVETLNRVNYNSLILFIKKKNKKINFLLIIFNLNFIFKCSIKSNIF
jgi:hypothetical protein